ncbi:NADP-dependent oxidoreductase [Streptomyces sp. AC512_CC834]|uniref:NADP-dependent oxidoreductase n=1 Tax=Streptomyces sp. AC512_CC834 TaxID=2823691 RepID=UPI0027E5089E|nr:NADP-dependent oxidoreductase [Streptomyces sp. AC512_CC834]
MRTDMKAVRYERYGSSEVLRIEQAERPAPGAGQVLVKVAGTTFNPVDATIREGYLKEVFPLELPHVPGIDVAGTVAETGDDVEGFAVGDAVIGFLPMNAPGAAAEYVLAPAAVLAAAPKTADPADAAALPSVALTAWEALFEYAGLAAGTGRSVLVNGASGAVGGYAVQLAARAGAVVTATSSPPHADRVRGYGAARIVDHTATTLAEAGVGTFDAVLNLVTTSPAETAELVGLVADGGVLVSTTVDAVPDPARAVRTARVFARSDANLLAELVALVDSGDLHIHIADRRPLADLPAVHAAAAEGRLPGKTVITV